MLPNLLRLRAMAKDNKISLSVTSIESIVLPSESTKDYWDSKVPGLYLRVSHTGSKVFYFRRWVDGKSRREKLGDFPHMLPEDARDEANKRNYLVSKGETAFQLDHAGEKTFGQVFQAYMSLHGDAHTRTASETHAFYRREFEVWVNEPVSKITKLGIQEWVNKIGETKKPTANRCLDIMKATFAWGLETDFIVLPKNPAKGVEAFPSVKRTRYIKPGSELDKWVAAVNSYKDPTLRDFFWMCLLTGARKSNVKSMRWGEIDFDTNHWKIPITKNGDSVTVPLTLEAVELLKSRRAAVEETVPWVFPSPRHSKSGHLETPKNAWRSILQEAGITDLRIHDLRHTLASHMVMNHVGLKTIGTILGHRSMASTNRYAHIDTDTAREAMQQGLKAFHQKYLID